MKRFFTMKAWAAIGMLALVELLTVGMGMGVPFFTIVAGFLVGWYVAMRHLASEGVSPAMLRTSLRDVSLAPAMTLVLMLAIWGPKFALLNNPSFDAAKWGIPLVLYTSTASFWGWQALMIVISPLLQLAAAVFAVYVSAAASKP
jgi:hypothetical protein